VYEIARQCRYAKQAYFEINEAFSESDSAAIWYAVQSFLISTANISKILWPPDKKYAKRGLKLRTILNVSDGSPLKNRDVRNHFEHFDERVHTWAENVSGEAFVDSSIMPLSRLEGMNPKNVARNFDQSTFSVTFFGDSFQLEQIIKEIESLYEKAKVELEKAENALLEE
jgi:hypothetical protein